MLINEKKKATPAFELSSAETRAEERAGFPAIWNIESSKLLPRQVSLYYKLSATAHRYRPTHSEFATWIVWWSVSGRIL